MAAFQFYVQSGNKKVRWEEDGSHVVFGKKNSLLKNEV
jgi:hypothetical protein